MRAGGDNKAPRPIYILIAALFDRVTHARCDPRLAEKLGRSA
jgi:hypothetical protein